jgi:citrate lyase subunit beta/citryl-CoA lyase
VRINADSATRAAELDFSVNNDIAALMLPKVERAEQIREIVARIEELEVAQGLPSGHTRLIAQIESVQALPRLDEIASSSPRLVGMILGSEDFQYLPACSRLTKRSMFQTS